MKHRGVKNEWIERRIKMDSKLHLFNFEGNKVRVLKTGEEPEFVGKDVAIILGYSNPQKALRDHVDQEDRTVNEMFTVNGTSPILINESGLYSLILSSKMPNAKRFKHWVTSEVLSAIRKHGIYMTDRKAYDITHDQSGTALADLLQQAADQLKQKDIQIKEFKPKAEYFDSQMRNPGLMTATEIAKDYGWSARNLNKELSKRHIIFKQGNHWVLYQEYADKGYAQYEPYDYPKNGDQRGVSNNLKWTQKGKKFIYGLLAQDGIRPLTEQIDSVEDDVLTLIERK